jgi:hypothetical protein
MYGIYMYIHSHIFHDIILFWLVLSCFMSPLNDPHVEQTWSGQAHAGCGWIAQRPADVSGWSEL